MAGWAPNAGLLAGELPSGDRAERLLDAQPSPIGAPLCHNPLASDVGEAESVGGGAGGALQTAERPVPPQPAQG